jgi:adenylate cyclase
MPGFRKAVGFAVFIAALGMVLRPTGVGVRLEEDLARGWLFSVRGAVEPPRGVAVISIDKTSSDQLGLNKEDWPPPRHVHAAVVRSLTRHGVSAIILDVFFRNQRNPAEDADLAAAMAESGKVALFERVERLKYSGGEIVQLRSPIEQFRTMALATGAFPLPDRSPVTFFWTFLDATPGKVPTLPAVALQMHALPHLDRLLSLLRDEGITNLTDLPGRVGTVDDFRQVMTVLSRELRTHAHAAQRALRRLEREIGNGMTAAERSAVAAVIRLYVGADTHDLNFYGPSGYIRTIPFHELLADAVSPRVDLAGMVVFVGEGATQLVSSADQRDTYSTVYSEDGVDLSGAEIAATAFANLLTNRTLRRVDVSAEAAILLAFALLAAFFARVLPVRLAAGAILGLGCAHYGMAQYLFSRHAVLIPVGIPLVVQGPLSLFAALWVRYRNVRRQVPTEVDPEMTPQQVHAVCLSLDIENYVAASEGLEPRDLARLMSEYYATLSALVSRREGVMMGRAGDSAMCVWAETRKPWPMVGWFRTPIGAQHAFDVRARANACRAALDIRDAVLRFNERHATPLRTRVGLHAGPVALGPVGGEYHVIGEVPNTASRIEGLNKTLGTTILASDLVVRQQEDFHLRPLGRFLLAGRSRPVDIVEIFGQRETIDEPTRELGRRFGRALAVFQSADLAKAGSLFQAIAEDYPSDGPSHYYHHLCLEQPASVAVLTSPPAIRIDVK